jgi:hypothetical protein
MKTFERMLADSPATFRIYSLRKGYTGFDWLLVMKQRRQF